VVTTTTTTTTTTTIPPPCVLGSITMTVDGVAATSVALKTVAPSRLSKDVIVAVSVASGYCVGLTLQYDSGGPNGQYIRNLGDAAPYTVTLEKPPGTELWSLGPHVLSVRDGANNLLGTTTLTTTT
jgi:hypothetical protein